ncbi:hypothetical protein DS742_12690 [Lacrimispora amygdalina]|uniref:Conjugal transfer protein TraX n=1 Tax=Lacrimispora amygdalina TaxID=253257 RepID=A0A3E2NBX2_9FIRM|nr:hypothetical protein DS742_12690 [Clostridium indicum]
MALAFMVIDHIGLFFPYAPIWFRYIGRMSAPIFVFCMVTGFSYTRNKKLYLIRMYLFGLGMGILDYILNCFADGDLVSNNIFVTLFCIGVIIRLIEYKRDNHPKFLTYLLCYCIWQVVGLFICYYVDIYSENIIYLFVGFMGNMFFNEGGFVFVSLGVLLYLIKDNKKYIAICYSLFCFLFSFITMAGIVPRIISRLDYYDYDALYYTLRVVFPLLGFNVIWIDRYSIQWMMIGALPFILFYNGKKGKSMKYFFYIFYPAHILIFFILSRVL